MTRDRDQGSLRPPQIHPASTDVWPEQPQETLERGRPILVTVIAALLALLFGLLLPYFGYHLNWAPHRLFKILGGGLIALVVLVRPTVIPHLLCFAFPFAAWLPKSPIPLLNAVNLLTLGSVLAVASLALRRAVRPVIPTTLNLPVLIFPSLLILSAIFGSYIYPDAVGVAMDRRMRELWAVASGFLVFYTTTHLIPDRRALWRVVASLIIATAVGVLGPVYESMQTRIGARAAGGLGEINQMAAFLAIGSIFAFSMMPAYRGLRKLGTVLSSAALAFGMFLPNSRGAYVGFLMAALPQALRTSVTGTVLFIAIVASGSVWAPSYVKDRVSVTWNAAASEDRSTALDETSGGRITIWKSIVPVVLEHPLVGVGYGNLRAATHLSLGYYKTGHNLFLEVAGEMGIPALLILLWIFVGGWRVASKLTRRGGRTAVLGRSYHGVVICLVIVNIFGQRFLNYSIAGFFFLLSGLVVLEERFTRPEATEEKSS